MASRLMKAIVVTVATTAVAMTAVAVAGAAAVDTVRTTPAIEGIQLAQDVPLLQYFFSQQTKTDYQKSVLMLITPRPASFTWLSEKSKAAFANSPEDSFTPSLDVMRARFSDWFKPYPNLASVFHHLNGADLYREFRTGDVTLETWDRMDSTRIRLKQAIDFLYY